jgi:hypothetical protein
MFSPTYRRAVVDWEKEAVPIYIGIGRKGGEGERIAERAVFPKER